MTPESGREQRLALLVVGTRPELIKMAPVVRALQDSSLLSLRLLHTGQHYDDSLSETFFDTLELPPPDVSLGVGSGTHAEQTAKALIGVEREIELHTPSVVLAQGDTNAVLSGALATSKSTSPFGHIEAGIRSFDRSMPEEVNRLIADDLSDYLFAPTDTAMKNLAAEGISDQVYVTGNTIVDACLEHRSIAAKKSTILNELDIESDEYVLATVHRVSNTEDPHRLRTIVDALDGMPFPVVLPAHPRTSAALADLGVEPSGSLILLDPLDYLDFLDLLVNASVVVTDSGGIQEEASVLETPCLTVRPNTERPETVQAGVNELVEPNVLAERLLSVYDDEVHDMAGATELYGDGTAGERIVEVLERELRTE